MVQAIHSFYLGSLFVRIISDWFASAKQNYTIAQDDYLIIDGLVWDRQRIRILRMAVEAARQGWCYKANAYLGELALNFGLDTYSLPDSLNKAMIYFGYSDREIQMLTNWINGYRTGIKEYIQTHKNTYQY